MEGFIEEIRKIKKWPVIASVLIVLLFSLLSFAAAFVAIWFVNSVFVNSVFVSEASQGFVEFCFSFISFFAVMVLVFVFDFKYIFFENRFNKATFFVLSFLFIEYIFKFVCLIYSVLSEIGELRFADGSYIFFAVIHEFLFCFVEEIVFRGMVTNLLASKYAKTRSGVIFCAALSGLIFGVAHMNNFLVADFLGVLVQCLSALCYGFFAAVLYLRCRNIWFLTMLHFINNFIAMFVSVFLRLKSVQEIIASYASVPSLVGVVINSMFLVLFSWILLRKGGIDEIVKDSKMFG